MTIIGRLPLNEIANRHGTDKGTSGPSGEWGGHNYCDIYEAIFAPLRQEAINLVEIGMGVTGENWDAKIQHGVNAEGGASVKMWHDYFENGRIFGLDINPARHLDNDRLTTFVLDQGDPIALKAFVKEAGVGVFDIIIDDGSHAADHQQISFDTLFPHLKSGGIYIIEDLVANGIGDHSHRNNATGQVVNTRTVFKSLISTGAFAAPNLLKHADAYLSDISSVTFHAPLPRQGAKNIKYTMGSERLCVIRKA
jgi:hypothetical protein